ncbi:MAG: DinB family protein [Anaerolineae bacterium]
MIVERLQKLATYNDWAWNHVIESVSQIPKDEFTMERPFFWGSLHGLLAHSLAAEIIWIERLNGNSPMILYGTDDFKSVEEIVDTWKEVRTRWQTYLNNLTDEQAMSICTFIGTEGNQRQCFIADIIQHVFNHATDHRSQMTPILYQLGYPTTSLDYIYFCEGCVS